jgi:predicted ArsR family transcriptional regulator
MAQCSICRSPRRGDIERALNTGQHSYRAVARDFGVSRDAVRRHVDGHLDKLARQQVLAVSPVPALDLAAALADIAEHAADVRHDADAAGNDKLALSAGRAEREARERLADRLGISTREALQEIHDASDLANAVLAAMRERPAIADFIADELEELGRSVWAKDMRHRAAVARAALAAEPVVLTVTTTEGNPS